MNTPAFQPFTLTRCARRKRSRWPHVPLWLCNLLAFLIVASVIAAVAVIPKLLAP